MRQRPRIYYSDKATSKLLQAGQNVKSSIVSGNDMNLALKSKVWAFVAGMILSAACTTAIFYASHTDALEPAPPSLLSSPMRWFVSQVDSSGKFTMHEFPTDPLRDWAGPTVRGGEADQINYRFDGINTDVVITYRPNAADFPLNLLRLLAARVVHGSRDDGISFEEGMQLLKNRQLSMTCGWISAFARRLLAEHGIKSRRIQSLTLDEWNTYDNGHTFLEVYLPSQRRWVAVDLDGKYWFSKVGGEPASALDIAQLGVDGIRFNKLANTPFLDYSGFDKYQVLGMFVSLNSEEWYRRMLQAIALETAHGIFVFAGTSLRIERVRNYSGSYKVASIADFETQFYGAD